MLFPMNLGEFLFLHVSVVIFLIETTQTTVEFPPPPLTLEIGVAVKLLLFVSVWN